MVMNNKWGLKGRPGQKDISIMVENSDFEIKALIQASVLSDAFVFSSPCASSVRAQPGAKQLLNP